MIRSVRARRGAAMLIATAALAAPSSAAAVGTDGFAPPAPVANGQCGTAVAAGDVNGDGRADVVLGCPGDDPGAVNGAGSALVFVRNAANSGFEAPVTLTHPSPTTLDGCGVSVAVADVNDDARADVIAGCDGDDTSRGSMVVFRRDGANTGFASGQVVSDAGQAADDNCGRRIAAGDLTGDGRADLVMGCAFADAPSKLTTGAARVFVSDGTTFAASTLSRPSPSDFDRCGEDVAVGDVNGDGRGDVVMLCSGTSKVAMVFASNAGGGFGAGADVAPGGGSSCSRVAAGDLTGDGRADLAIGCTQTTAPNGQFSGAAAVFTRSAGNSGFDGPSWLYPPTPVNGAACAQGLAIADAAGTPARDLIMGCSAEATNTGSALVFPSLGAAGFAAARPFTSPTAATGQRCGFSVGAGDVDQNGGGDLLLGCYGQNTGATSSGGAVVFYGTPEDPGTPPEPVVPPGPAPVAPPAPAPGPVAPTATDASPGAVSARVPTVPAIPINADGSYTSPVVVCDEQTGKCTILMDPRVRPSAPRAAKAKPKTISLGAVRFTVDGGRRGSGRGKLNKAGRALLAKRRNLPVTFEVKITDSAGNVRRLTVKTTLKRAKAKRR